GFCEADYPLGRVHVGIWDGHIFLNMAERPISLDQHLVGLGERFRNWAMHDLRVVEQRSYQVHANWKLIIQNYHECLHCPVAHPQLNRQSHSLRGVNHPPTSTYLGSRMDLREGFRTLSSSDDPRRAPFPGLSEDERRGVYYYAILPNLLLNLHPDYVLT